MMFAAGWYEVYRAGPTCADLAATFNFRDQDSYARSRAIAKAESLADSVTNNRYIVASIN